MNTFWIICFDVIMKSFINLSYIEKNNMIKKLLLWLFVSFVWLISFSYAIDTNSYWQWYVRSVWSMWRSAYNSWFSLAVLNKWSFLSQNFWVWKDLFFIDENKYFAWIRHPEYWNTALYYHFQCWQWFATSYLTCDEIFDDSTGATRWWPKNCHQNNVVAWTYEILSSFMSSVKSTDYIWYVWEWSCCWTYCWSRLGLCISSSDYHQSICWWWCNAWSPWYSCSFLSETYWYNVNNSLNLSGDYASINRSILLTSPWVNNNFNPWTWSTISDWTTKYLNADIDDYISYYEERFGWNENMCYVWTTDYETLYWSWRVCNDLECPDTVNFEYWTGWTIFDLYYSLYSGFWNNIIKNVWTFINVRLINYTEQFKLNCNWTGDNIVCQPSWPDYLAKYNWPDTNISLYYEWLTPPFLNNPVAIYFMASNLYNRFSTESTQWEEMAYYCDMKLNYDSYKDWTFNFEELKDKVTPWINQRVKDYKNNQFWNGGGYSIPDFSWTNIRWNLNLTGDWIPEDLSPTQLFKQFYDRMNALLWNFNPNNSVWIIPLWILYPMLFLILFRIIKH